MARAAATTRAIRGSVPHDEVVVAGAPRAARPAAVPLQHLRGGPAVQLHQVALGPAAIQPGMAEVVPEPVRVYPHASLVTAALDHLVDPVAGQRPPAAGPEPQPQAVRLLVPGADREVAVDPAGGFRIDPDRPVPAALAADMNLPAVQVQVAAVRITGVVADPGQLGQPDARPPEPRQDRRVAALRERAAPAGFLQFGKFYAGEERHRLLPHRRRAQPRHGISDLVLLSQPAEELPQRPVLLACVRLAVATQQPPDPPLDILRVHLLPPGLLRLAEQVSGGEPQRRLGIDPDRPGRLVLRRQMQPERGDISRERPRVQSPGTKPAPVREDHSFTLIRRLRARKTARYTASGHSGTAWRIWRIHYRKTLLSCVSAGRRANDRKSVWRSEGHT